MLADVALLRPEEGLNGSEVFNRRGLDESLAGMQGVLDEFPREMLTADETASLNTIEQAFGTFVAENDVMMQKYQQEGEEGVAYAHQSMNAGASGAAYDEIGACPRLLDTGFSRFMRLGRP